MKIKFNILAAGVVMALASATASAKINVSSTPDLLFVAYDTSTGNTYVRDIGSINQLTTSQTFNAPASSIFGSQFSSSAATSIKWDVFALDNTADTNVIYGTGSLSNYAGLADIDVSTVASILTGELGGLTQLDLAANGFAKPNGEYTGVKNVSDQTNGAQLAVTFGFGTAVSGKVGTSMNFLTVGTDGTASQLYTNAQLSAFNGNAAGGYFTLTDANGDLTWTNSAVAAVPLPGAALLFVPGLLGLFGLGRRNKAAAAA